MISDFHGPVLTSSINGEPFVDAAVVTLSREALKSSETISLVLIDLSREVELRRVSVPFTIHSHK